MEDFYCDGDMAPLGRLNYIYQNYIPGVSEITYTDPETAAPVTESPSEPVTDAPEGTSTDAVTDQPEGGCASVLGSAWGILAVLAGASLLLRRKDDEHV